jgi:hypothetical protein
MKIMTTEVILFLSMRINFEPIHKCMKHYNSVDILILIFLVAVEKKGDSYLKFISSSICPQIQF